MISDKYRVENCGDNSGVMVANNNGSIYFTMQKAIRIPSLISNVVKVLGNVCIDEEYSASGVNIQEFKPDDKIEYNGVVVYKEIIKEFAAYYSTCDNYLNAYDDSNIRGKAKILKCVHMWYLRAKGQIMLEYKAAEKSEMEIIRENSDRIIDMVKEQILQVVKSSREMDSIYQEDLDLGIACFTCYCFMECKILEKPL